MSAEFQRKLELNDEKMNSLIAQNKEMQDQIRNITKEKIALKTNELTREETQSRLIGNQGMQILDCRYAKLMSIFVF